MRTPSELLEADDQALSEYLENVPLEEFREMLAAATTKTITPASNWKITHDGLQWVLRRNYETDELGEDRKPTGAKKQAEALLGYYPKFHQALARCYEEMMAEGLGAVEGAEIGSAVEVAKQIFVRLQSPEVLLTEGVEVKIAGMEVTV